MHPRQSAETTPIPQEITVDLQPMQREQVATYMDTAEESQERYGINGALVAVVECNPTGKYDGDEFYIFDLGAAGQEFLDTDRQMAVTPENRYVVMTGRFMDDRLQAAEGSMPAEDEGHGWRSFPAIGEQVIGRSNMANLFGTAATNTTSWEHFQLNFSYLDVAVTDLRSTNHTRLIHGDLPRPPQPETESDPEAAVITKEVDWGVLDGGEPGGYDWGVLDGGVPSAADAEAEEKRSLKELQEAIPDYGKEFEVDGITYRYEGSAFRGHAFSSVGADGKRRRFFVYRSNSEGGLRASQGMEQARGGPRYLKGAERSEQHQYTQDTQLHPDFERQTLTILQRKSPIDDPAEAYVRQRAQNAHALTLDRREAEKAKLDFEEQITSVRLGSRQLNHLLYEVGVDGIEINRMRALVGMESGPSEEVWKAYLAKIEQINDMLEREKLIPDFTERPSAIHMDEHPKLGTTLTEVYEKTDAYGTTYQWFMTHNNDGRAWISRIRQKDSEATLYGTDAQVVMSGILTVKPVEYTFQATGLPSNLKTEIDRDYSDISKFTELLAPVRLYKQAYPSRGTLQNWGPARGAQDGTVEHL